MMKTIKYFLALFILMTVLSCDPVTYATIYFKNHSSEKINLHYKGRSMSSDTTIEVNANETIKLLVVESMGSPKEYNCCTCEFDILAVSAMDSSKQITKNIQDEINWKVDKSNVKKWKNHKVDGAFELIDSDFQ